MAVSVSNLDEYTARAAGTSAITTPLVFGQPSSSTLWDRQLFLFSCGEQHEEYRGVVWLEQATYPNLKSTS